MAAAGWTQLRLSETVTESISLDGNSNVSGTHTFPLPFPPHDAVSVWRQEKVLALNEESSENCDIS